MIDLRRLLLAVIALTGVGAFAATQSIAQQADDARAIVEAWLASPHATASSPAFTHWDSEGEIPANCATCHSGIGFRDFLGADGSAPGIVDHPIPIGSVIDCESCHNDAAESLSSVTFPSGAVVSDIRSGAQCLVCHQGLQSTPGVNAAVAEFGEDDVNAQISFVNVHYRAAAATQMGTEVRGAYEYAGKTYMGRFQHVPPFSTCTDCHDPHTLTVAVEQCTGCHQVAELSTIRISPTDFDGNGDTGEGIAAEIGRLHEILGGAITDYAAAVAGEGAVYADAYPYFFADGNGNGIADPDEAVFPNRYRSWTPRLLKAAYNYQFVAKDPGAYAHNPHYALQILYDSIQDLAEWARVEMAGLQRP
jgi:hypothetical protein